MSDNPTAALGRPVSDYTRPRGKSPQRYLQDADGGSVQRPRIPDATWHPALERAAAEGQPIGHVLTALLDGWLAGDYVLEDQSDHLDWPADVRRQACATPCTDPTHHRCPNRGPEEPHHIGTRGSMNGREQFCVHCHKSAAELRSGLA